VERPPSDAEWLIDGLSNGGHTPGETMATMAWKMDWFDECQRQQWADDVAIVVSAGGVDRRPHWLRRLLRS
jgi:hypothetical protein